jgi:hypothetical protein
MIYFIFSLKDILSNLIIPVGSRDTGVVYRQIKLGRTLAICTREEGVRESNVAGLFSSVIHLPQSATFLVVFCISFLCFKGQESS